MGVKRDAEKDHVFTIRISKDERLLYQRAAEIEGFRDLAPWVRRILGREARSVIWAREVTTRKGASDGR